LYNIHGCWSWDQVCWQLGEGNVRDSTRRIIGLSDIKATRAWRDGTSPSSSCKAVQVQLTSATAGCSSDGTAAAPCCALLPWGAATPAGSRKPKDSKDAKEAAGQRSAQGAARDRSLYAKASRAFSPEAEHAAGSEL